MSNEIFFQKYATINVISSESQINCYLANKINNDPKKLFLINEIADRNIIDSCILELMSMKELKDFYDFVECFSENSKFYVVFSYSEGKNIIKYFEKDRFAFDYRLELLEKILRELDEKNNLNNILKASMLNPENIIFYENMISFNYRIFINGYIEDINNDSSVYSSFCNLFQFFFSESEIGKNDKLKIIQKKCEKNLYTSLDAVIKDLEGVSKAIVEERRLKDILLEKKKKYTAVGAKILMAAVFCVLVFTVFSKIIKNNQEVAVYKDVEQIGNVDIVSGNVSSKESVENIFIENASEVQSEADTQTSEADTQAETTQTSTEITSESEITSGDTEDLTEDTTVSEKTYTVQVNDNLTDIVIQEYGSDKYVERVREYNKISDGNIIRVGQVIKLPEISD